MDGSENVIELRIKPMDQNELNFLANSSKSEVDTQKWMRIRVKSRDEIVRFANALIIAEFGLKSENDQYEIRVFSN